MSVITPPTVLIPMRHPPFPLPNFDIQISSSVFSIGCDIIEHSRFQKHWKPEWFSRIYSEFEITQFCDKIEFPQSDILTNPPTKIPDAGLEFLASRWTVKEAAIKAFGMFKTVLPNEIEVLHFGNRPQLHFGPSLSFLSSHLSLRDPLVSISHTDSVSMAIVILQSSDSEKTDSILLDLCKEQNVNLQKGEFLQMKMIQGISGNYPESLDIQGPETHQKQKIDELESEI